MRLFDGCHIVLINHVFLLNILGLYLCRTFLKRLLLLLNNNVIVVTTKSSLKLCFKDFKLSVLKRLQIKDTAVK